MSTESFPTSGFALIPDILPAAECEAIAARIQPGAASGGTRCLLALAWCAALARHLRLHPALSGLIPAGHVAVQCTYFEKSASRNWLVPLHQDLSIPVARRVDVPGLRGWSQKEGALFVQAPAGLLAQLVAVRVHLDACGADDGPLRVLPGSHRLGLVAPEAAVLARNAAAEVTCDAAPGDALVMRPLLLHASSKASGQSRRRVLHFVFGPPLLTHGMAWRQAV